MWLFSLFSNIVELLLPHDTDIDGWIILETLAPTFDLGSILKYVSLCQKSLTN